VCALDLEISEVPNPGRSSGPYNMGIEMGKRGGWEGFATASASPSLDGGRGLVSPG